MLRFDSTHTSLNGKVSSQSGISVGKTAFLGFLALPIMFFSGCNKTIPCDVEDSHAHLYKNKDSFSMYMMGEKEYSDFTGEFKRCPEYINVDEREAAIINVESKNTLFRITNNIDQINDITSNHKSAKEYRYKYEWTQSYMESYDIGDQTYHNMVNIDHTDYAWTLNPNHPGATGETREVCYVYTGYKIETNEDGKLVIVESEPYSSIKELQDAGFTHIKKDFYKKVLANDIEKTPDYESRPDPAIQEFEITKNNSR